ncbi:MAG: hypothetical protein KHX03_01345 [Clostridium sp.]|nr:hypothetical protein [Clostridium sp.]
MQKVLFILLNLILSMNLPIWIILNWNGIFNVGDSVDIMAYTGIAYILFSFFYAVFKLEIFSLFVKYSQFFKFTSKFLNDIKLNKKLRNIVLILVFIVDMLFLLLTYFSFKNQGWSIKALPFIYLFSLGGVFISYISFLTEHWLKNRFNEKYK